MISKYANIGKKNGMYGKKHTKEAVQLMREARLGKKDSVDTKEKKRKSALKTKNKGRFMKGLIPWNKNLTKETDERVKLYGEKVSKSLKGLMKKEKNPNWKGGIWEKSVLCRYLKKYNVFRTKVFVRDNHTCKISNQVGGSLVVHHLKSFTKFPNLRYDESNGITITEELHDEFHTIYGKINFTEEQFYKFTEVKKNGCTIS